MSTLSISRLFFRLPAPLRMTPAAMLALYRQRHTLARLNDAALDDIGVTRAQALAEAKRPLWDAPAHWAHAAR
jgi:uncharacterized protein YjiS (DUF1127 family)